MWQPRVIVQRGYIETECVYNVLLITYRTNVTQRIVYGITRGIHSDTANRSINFQGRELLTQLDSPISTILDCALYVNRQLYKTFRIKLVCELTWHSIFHNLSILIESDPAN